MDGWRPSEMLVIAWCALAIGVAARRRLPPARRSSLMLAAAALAGAAALMPLLPPHGPPAAVRNVLPALFVAAAYWVAGIFFVAPQPRLEQRLLRVDATLLAALRWRNLPARQTRWAALALEVCYLGVYPLLPLGAWAAWSAGGHVGVDRYWCTVFLAEASCYLCLAWLQTRPPRLIEATARSVPNRSMVRRVNEGVLRHVSHGMNTIPSGHAAGAVAVALALASAGSSWAIPFGVVALGIVLATVLGRYHFLVDTVAGVLVAVLSWCVVDAWYA